MNNAIDFSMTFDYWPFESLMKKPNIPFAIAMGSALITSSNYAADNNATANAGTNIETITVLGETAISGANIGGIDIKNLPLNAHVVGQAEIERIRFVDPDELLDRIPGETQVRNLRIPDGGKSYTLGFVDGIPIENPYGGATARLDRVNTYDIQRVEVIKGPTSALYPNNVFGGVVNVITRDAPDETEVGISAELGNFNRQRFDVNLGSTIGNFGYFVDVNTRRLDGLREGAHNDRDNASAKFTYQINQNTKLFSRLELIEEDFEARGDLTAEQINEDPTQAGTLSESTEFEQDVASFGFSHNLATGLLDGSILRRTKNSIGQSRFSGPQDSEDIGINFNLKYRHDLQNGTLIVGLDNYDGEENVQQFDRDDTELTGESTAFSTHLDIAAYFAQYQTNLSNNLSMTVGLRYEDITSSSTIFAEQETDFSDLAPKLGFNYHLSEEQQIWFSVSEGFYAPNVDDLFDLENGNPNLQPEEAQNIELGFRGNWGNWAYDSSLYHNEIANYLVTQEFFDATGNEFELTTNAGQVTVKGVESVIEYSQPDSNWRLGLTHTYTDNRYDSFVQSTVGAEDDLTGNILRRSPDHHLNVRLAVEPIDKLTIELEGDFYSSYFADNANSPESKFTRDERINLRMSYEHESWRYWVNVLNITDTLEDRATFSRGTMTFRTVDGLNYYAGMSYQF